MSDGKWTYNFNDDELWTHTSETFDTREEALAAAKEAALIEYGDDAGEDDYGCIIYTGQMHDIRRHSEIQLSGVAQYMLEMAMGELHEQCGYIIGEAAECWPDISGEDQQRAGKAIERVLRWLVRRSDARYHISDIQQH